MNTYLYILINIEAVVSKHWPVVVKYQSIHLRSQTIPLIFSQNRQLDMRLLVCNFRTLKHNHRINENFTFIVRILYGPKFPLA